VRVHTTLDYSAQRKFERAHKFYLEIWQIMPGVGACSKFYTNTGSVHTKTAGCIINIENLDAAWSIYLCCDHPLFRAIKHS